ncbi:hypothetical protein Zm00014a_021507 [Zea mays]|uniref:Uncharacterized protein n=1 Tax=Zea mays TaxID=4577 RepID=A0A3L6G666_MAIZE|nr:hypothetical protein Zm00014a_021507 [Zea mays]
MESKVEAEAVQLAGKKQKSTFPSSAADDGRVEAASMGIMASSPSAASPAAIVSAFLAPPLSLLRHVTSLCAGYLGLDGGLKPPASSSSSVATAAAAAAASQRGEVVEAAASVVSSNASSCLTRSRPPQAGFC